MAKRQSCLEDRIRSQGGAELVHSDTGILQNSYRKPGIDHLPTGNNHGWFQFFFQCLITDVLKNHGASFLNSWNGWLRS